MGKGAYSAGVASTRSRAPRVSHVFHTHTGSPGHMPRPRHVQGGEGRLSDRGSAQTAMEKEEVTLEDPQETRTRDGPEPAEKQEPDKT